MLASLNDDLIENITEWVSVDASDGTRRSIPDLLRLTGRFNYAVIFILNYYGG
jgi:hypothetical protein